MEPQEFSEAYKALQSYRQMYGFPKKTQKSSHDEELNQLRSYRQQLKTDSASLLAIKHQVQKQAQAELSRLVSLKKTSVTRESLYEEKARVEKGFLEYKFQKFSGILKAFKKNFKLTNKRNCFKRIVNYTNTLGYLESQLVKNTKFWAKQRCFEFWCSYTQKALEEKKLAVEKARVERKQYVSELASYFDNYRVLNLTLKNWKVFKAKRDQEKAGELLKMQQQQKIEKLKNFIKLRNQEEKNYTKQVAQVLPQKTDVAVQQSVDTLPQKQTVAIGTELSQESICIQTSEPTKASEPVQTEPPEFSETIPEPSEPTPEPPEPKKVPKSILNMQKRQEERAKKRKLLQEKYNQKKETELKLKQEAELQAQAQEKLRKKELQEKKKREALEKQQQQLRRQQALEQLKLNREKAENFRQTTSLKKVFEDWALFTYFWREQKIKASVLGDRVTKKTFLELFAEGVAALKLERKLHQRHLLEKAKTALNSQLKKKVITALQCEFKQCLDLKNTMQNHSSTQLLKKVFKQWKGSLQQLKHENNQQEIYNQRVVNKFRLKKLSPWVFGQLKAYVAYKNHKKLVNNTKQEMLRKVNQWLFA